MKYSTCKKIGSCCLVELVVVVDHHEKDLPCLGLQHGGLEALPYLGPVSIKSIDNLWWRKSGRETCIQSLGADFFQLLNLNVFGTIPPSSNEQTIHVTKIGENNISIGTHCHVREVLLDIGLDRYSALPIN